MRNQREEGGLGSRPSIKERLASIGRQVATYRALRGLTQAALARKVGVHPSAISRLETGALPSVEVLMRVAEALGVGLAEITAEPRRPVDLRILLRDPQAPITYDGRPLTPVERDRIVELVDTALALRQAQPVQGPLAASMADRGRYGEADPAFVAWVEDIVRRALEAYDRRSMGTQRD